MAAATLSPSPKEYFFNIITGAPLAGGLVYTVTAGGSVPGSNIATYQDSNALILNSNPILLNAAGYATIYLQPGKTYKYIVTDANGVLQYTADGIEAVPTTNLGLDITGTAGVAFTAGQAAYMAQDASGGATPGLFYLGDSANTYSSTLPAVVAMATTAIAAGATGTFRQGGIVAGLSGLIAGSKYYIGTAGAITATAPSNARLIGIADNTTTQIDVVPGPALTSALLVSPTITTSIITPASAGIGYGVCGGRLTLTAGTPVTTADVTAAVSIFFSPYSSNGSAIGNIGLYDGSTNWTILPFAELTLAVGTLTSGLPYDIFAFNNAGVVALRAPVAWTNGTTRATALVLQNGVYVKSGATTDRYLGSFYTTSTTTTEDSILKRNLFNYYNRRPRTLLQRETTANWTYSTATWRQANASTANQVEVMMGVAEDPVSITGTALASNGGAAVNCAIGIGVDSTTVPSTAVIGGSAIMNNNYMCLQVTGEIYPGVGRHLFQRLEISAATPTTTWLGIGSLFATIAESGLKGAIQA